MAIQIPDQGSVDLGRSRIQPAETYVQPENPGRGGGGSGGLDELASSLAKLGVQVGASEEEKKKNAEYAAAQKVDWAVNQVRQSDTFAMTDRVKMGELLPDADPKTIWNATALAGAAFVESELNKEWTSILADQTLMSNPQALQEKLAASRKYWTEQLQGKDDFFKNGGIKYFDRWEESILKEGRSISVQEMQKNFLTDYSKGNVSVGNLKAAENTAQKAAQIAGLDPQYIVPFIKVENASGDPNARNQAGSTAGGLTQITDATWDYLVKKYGSQYGVTYDQKFNPDANALMGALYAKENKQRLETSLGRQVTPAEVYMAHFFGPVRALSFIQKVQENPGTNPIEFLGSNVVNLNPGVFYKDPRNKQGLKSLGEVHQEITKKIDGNNFYVRPVVRYDGKPPTMMDHQTFYSKHYRWTDLVNDGKNGGEGQIDGNTIQLLDTVTDVFGRKLKITSASRSDGYNKSIGGASDSQHTHGTALDISTEGMSDEDKKRLVATFIAHGARGVGHYANNNSIHIDLRAQGGSKQPDGTSLWYGKGDYTKGEKWFIDGVAQGRQWRDGGTVPVSGFNGKPMNPWEARIREANGLSPSTAREQLIKDMILTATNQQDHNSGRRLLDDLRQGIQMTPTEASSVRQALQLIDEMEQRNVTKRKQMEDELFEKKTKPEILREMAESKAPGGKPFNIAKWIGNAKAYEYAKQVSNDELLSEDDSMTNQRTIRDQVFKMATKGDFTEMGLPAGRTPTEGEYSRWLDRQPMRSSHRTELKKEAGKTLAGANLIRDPEIKEVFKDTIGSLIDIRLKNIQDAELMKVAGIDIKGNALNVFMRKWQEGVLSHLASTNVLPSSYREMKSVLKEAQDETMAHVEYMFKALSDPKANAALRSGAVDTVGRPTFNAINAVPPNATFLGTSVIGGMMVQRWVGPKGEVYPVEVNSMIEPPARSGAPLSINQQLTNEIVAPPAQPAPVRDVEPVPQAPMPQGSVTIPVPPVVQKELPSVMQKVFSFMNGRSPEQQQRFEKLLAEDEDYQTLKQSLNRQNSVEVSQRMREYENYYAKIVQNPDFK